MSFYTLCPWRRPASCRARSICSSSVRSRSVRSTASAIADRIKQVTRGTFEIKAGSLFPALHRLEADGWVSGEWGATSAGRRAKLYTLTKEGRKHLAAEQKSWARVALAIQQVLEMQPEA